MGDTEMRGLYAIVDVEVLVGRAIDPVAFADAVLAAGPCALQLRAKQSPPRETLALLRALAPMCHRSHVPLIANDRPDLALFAGCDMVHVGQTDMPLERVRRLAPTLGVGVSTHTIEQLNASLWGRPSYAAFGPVFETATKLDPDPVVGEPALREAYRLAVAAGVPLVAIGGITRERARSIAGAADAVAVISGLLPSAGTPMDLRDTLADVTARARAYVDLFPPVRSALEAAV